MRTQWTYAGLAGISVALWTAVGALCLAEARIFGAVVAGVAAVETAVGVTLWRRGLRGHHRDADRVSSPHTADYVHVRERVIRELDTCQFPRPLAAEAPDGFAAMTYHLGYEAGAASATSRS